MKSPFQSIRAFCLECYGGSFQCVNECNNAACPFYKYRHGEALEAGKHKPLAAIKTYCFYNCQAGTGRDEVIDCEGDKSAMGACPVFKFRLGTNPNRKGIGGNPAFMKKAQLSTPFDVPESTKCEQAILWACLNKK